MDSMNKIKQAMQHFQNSFQESEKANRILSGGPSSYYFEKIAEYIDVLFTRFAPFHEDDRVVLVKAPPCTGNWTSCKHFLVPGNIGTVSAVDYHDGHFWADVVFDRETWIDDKGKEQPVIMKHTFHIKDLELRTILVAKETKEAEQRATEA